MSLFQCDNYPKIFTSLKLLQRLFSNVHHELKSAISWDVCGKQFVNRFKMNNHKANVHKTKKCTACNIEISVANYKRHMNKKHESQPIINCDTCGKAFTRKGHLERHKISCVIHQCTNCTTTFLTKTLLNKHNKLVKGKNFFPVSSKLQSQRKGVR